VVQHKTKQNKRKMTKVIKTNNKAAKVVASTEKYLPLIKLGKKQLMYVESEWHHAVLSSFNVKPSEDNLWNDMELEFDEIQKIISKYGKYPPSYYSYWEELKLKQ
jgi:hypothetical protein